MRKTSLTKSELDILLLSLYEEFGYLSIPLMEQNSSITRRTLRTHYKTLKNFMTIKNLAYVKPPQNKGIARSKAYSEEQVLNEVYRLVDEFGYFSKSLLENHGHINHKVFRRLYGTFDEFYKKFPGIIRHKMENNFSEDELINSLRKVFNDFGFISAELINLKCVCSLVTYLKRFNSIEEACLKAKLPYNKSWKTKAENIIVSRLEEVLGCKAIRQYKTELIKRKRKLPIDAYFPDLNLAVEYNGKQHYQFIELFHRDLDSFTIQVKKDSEKYIKIQEAGMKLLIIPYWENETSYIKRALLLTNP